MALEEDIAELDSVLDGLNDMMNDLNVRGVLEFFPTNNNNNAFQEILQAEMDVDGPAGKLLRTLSRDDGRRNSRSETKKLSSSTNDFSSNGISSAKHSSESLQAKRSVNSSCCSFISTSSASYDENIVDLRSSSEANSHSRSSNSIAKVKTDSSSSEDCLPFLESARKDAPQTNGDDLSKLLVTVYFQERSVEIDLPAKATARDLAHRLVIINRLQNSHEWTIFDYFKTYDLERNLEDHEMVGHVISRWENASDHRLQMKNFTKKYEFFERPSIYLPSYLIGNDDKTKTDTLRADDSWLPECYAYRTSGERVPQLENYLHMKGYHKKSWNRKYCLLKATGIFSSSKSGFKRSSREVKCNVDFSSTSLYLTPLRFDVSHSAPSTYCFCFVPETLAGPKGIKCFCAENEQVMQSWIMGYRLAKFGSKLYRNYKVATYENRAAKTVSAPVEMDTVVRRKRPSIDHRVPIDFSGSESRVVSDPDAARALKDSLSSRLPKRLKRRSTGSCHSPYSSGIPAIFEKPWFHGKLEREQAAKRLRSAGMEEGLFLVRESCTSSGVNVISVVKKKKILHHQVFQAVGEGQIFYGLEHGPRFQSLDQLIEFYQNYRHAGKAPLLKRPCKRVDKSS